MKPKGRNGAASVQARLLQLARNSKLSLRDLLERYCTERLLYRLSRSPHHSQFILKGTMLLMVWGEGSIERVTRDADLPGWRTELWVEPAFARSRRDGGGWFGAGGTTIWRGGLARENGRS